MRSISEGSRPLSDAKRDELAVARAVLTRAEEKHLAACDAYMALMNLVLCSGGMPPP